ncbi:TIGR04282 family arsenosugar biosynthesis glycosyltransferase [Roseimaritima ulvae]|uniref:2-phospho-L-lactate guanylyltransferase n=1 Tax=Roseimaritima ulvae TaxID=980254 RepID=A0A5B9R0D4_9BACT|nr:TIGR04282 family arsenosugar biosynthesis glycosyltransferase [Roseimaritima ulvae]QEG42876.1 2-phospho-L-lactate guanylyltransferase [Roseimaritima ulvae]
MITPTSLLPQRQLCLFAKHWVTGTVKTRLGADLGMQPAADLHHLFVRHLTDRLPPTPASPQLARPLLAVAPDSAIDQFSEISPSWNVIAQGSGDLGQRLQRMFQNQLSERLRLLVIGADCPDLPAATLEAAWEQLRAADVVLGPASDGGYYLLGLRGPWEPWMARLFEQIAWSQAEVAETTRRRVAEQGRSLGELETRDDVDTLADLQRLAQRLTAAPPSDARHTAGDDAAKQRLLAGIADIIPDRVAAWTAMENSAAEEKNSAAKPSPLQSKKGRSS